MSIGIGVIGAGGMGLMHASIIHAEVPGANLAAVADANVETARSVAEQFSARTAYEKGDELINDASVDIVVVASPNDTHHELVMECLRLGKRVLCEKPLALSPSECLSVVKAEQKRQAKLVQVGFMRRFDPSYESVKDICVAGRLGQVKTVRCIHRNVQASSMLTTEKAIASAAVHEFDVARWLLDDEIASVLCTAGGGDGGSHLRDPLLFLLRMRSEVLMSVELFMNARYGYDVRMEVCCSEGYVELAEECNRVVTTAGLRNRPLFSDWRLRFRDAYRLQMRQWAHNEEHSGVASAWDGYMASCVAEAATKSLSTGIWVDVTHGEQPSLYLR